jgi:hypothetical protein
MNPVAREKSSQRGNLFRFTRCGRHPIVWLGDLATSAPASHLQRELSLLPSMGYIKKLWILAKSAGSLQWRAADIREESGRDPVQGEGGWYGPYRPIKSVETPPRIFPS